MHKEADLPLSETCRSQSGWADCQKLRIEVALKEMCFISSSQRKPRTVSTTPAMWGDLAETGRRKVE